jgi:hypothetical protein
MGAGKWYFVYACMSMGGMLSSHMEDNEVELKATIEEEAIKEGQAMWDKITDEQRAYCKGTKIKWNPNDPFETGPCKPRVIYKIKLETKK